MAAALMVPETVLDSLRPLSGDSMTVTELAARAIRSEQPWDKTSMKVDGIERSFMRFGWDAGIVFVSVDPAVQVSVFDSRRTRLRRELTSALVSDLPA